MMDAFIVLFTVLAIAIVVFVIDRIDVKKRQVAH